MAYTKTNWVNNGTPPLSAANLNNIENGIYNCDSAINKMATYSTSETPVGTWVDGKIIYRKVFLVETTSVSHTAGQVLTVPLGTNHNIKMLIRFDCIAVGNNSNNSEVNKYITPCRLDKNANTLTLDCNAAYGTNSVTVIIEYIKNN